MKPKALLITYITLIFILPTQAQSDDQIKSADQRSYIFTAKERDSLQIWFYNRATTMGLSDNLRDEFYNIILFYSNKMSRLDDKDKDYSEEQRRKKFEELLARQHDDIKAILTEDQYQMYLKTYEKILDEVYERNQWER